MRILFITSIYPSNWENYLQSNAKGIMQKASNLFQSSIINGLLECNVNFEIFCFPSLPAFPIHYKKLYSPKDRIFINGKYIGQMFKYCNLIIYKTISIRRKLQKELSVWLSKNNNPKEKIIILTYTPYPAYLKACKRIKNKYPNIIVTSIITDLVDNMMSFDYNNKFYKKIQCYIEYKQTKALYNHIDRFILLSKYMEEKIPQSKGKNLVIEGIYTPTKQIGKSTKNNNVSAVLYSGSMLEFAGIKQLVNAFIKTTNPKFRLWLCGSGELVPFIMQQCQYDKRIKYYGILPYAEVIHLQSIATCLINPRMPNGDITKYSFPSKTMEYMASGTPMIGYHLEGIPSEYYQYMHSPKDLSIDALKNLIEQVLTLPEAENEAFGQRARQFILEKKTAEKQVMKIIEFIK